MPKLASREDARERLESPTTALCVEKSRAALFAKSDAAAVPDAWSS
jgi:hypothetical protein